MEQLDQFSKTQLIINQQDNGKFIQYAFFALKMLVVFIILLLILRRKKRDLKKLQIKQSYVVPKQKIIVAIEINDFFIKVQHRPKSGFQPLQTNFSQSNLIYKTLAQFLGFKYCFKTLYSLRQITTFVKTLKNTPNVELMIYTSINPYLTDQILRKMKLSEFFPPQNRKFCNPKQVDMTKHAIDVDKQSRRVIIVTPSKKDHNWEDQKYFLVLNPKGGRKKGFMKDSLRIIKNLVEQNQGLDSLHDELAQLKIDVQDSDMSDMSDIEKQIS